MATKGSIQTAVLLAIALAAPGLAPASQGNGPPELAIPVNADAEWWQFVLSFPLGQDPVSDPTGALCQVGQRGGTWYLYGTFTSAAAHRECTLPTGKQLFFPVFNQVNVAFPGDTPKLLRSQIAPLIDAADVLEVDVDGEALPPAELRRLTSGVFEVVLQEDNLFDAFFPIPAGIYGPAVADGIWVLLSPLPEGDHEIRILGGIGAPFVDVTYHLHVVAPQGIVPP
jgi:hypothetical protein